MGFARISFRIDLNGLEEVQSSESAVRINAVALLSCKFYIFALHKELIRMEMNQIREEFSVIVTN